MGGIDQYAKLARHFGDLPHRAQAVAGIAANAPANAPEKPSVPLDRGQSYVCVAVERSAGPAAVC